MNARVVANVKAQLAKVVHLSAAALDPEVRELVASVGELERAKLRQLALLIVRATTK